jgi:acyl carrier protein
MSSREEIEREVRRIVSDAMDGEIAPQDLPLDVPIFSGGLGMDSMSGVELLGALEERFDIYIDDDNFEIFDSLQLMIDFVAEASAGNQA